MSSQEMAPKAEEKREGAKAMVNLTINNKPVTVEAGTLILDACKQAGFYVPTLCHHPDLRSSGGVCGICMVEVVSRAEPEPVDQLVDTWLVKACKTPVSEGMVIYTDSPKVVEERKRVLRRILKYHKNDCLTCVRVGGDCQLQDICIRYGVQELNRLSFNRGIDDSAVAMVRDMDKCIACERCIRMCQDVQGIGVYELVENEKGRYSDTKGGVPLAESACVFCGQCVKVCPVGALTERDQIFEVIEAIMGSDKHVVVQQAPAVHHLMAEEFGLPPGTDVTGKLNAALRRLGVDKVFSTDFTADLTIMEEANELLQRIKHGGPLPMFTSCSPGWVRFLEINYPQLIPNVSSCKSPQQMAGALFKTYYAEKAGIPPEKIFSLSIMPCTAKKYEAARPEMGRNGLRDVDVVLTVRELARLFRLQGINLVELEDEPFDHLLGGHTGAARIFANTGGVMEAALRTAVYWLTGGQLPKIDFEEVRGLKGCREATLEVAGMKIRVAVAHGLGAARRLVERVLAGEPYHFIEVMACPGGCIGGGGAPIPDNLDIKAKRIQGVYETDKKLPLRMSHENPEIQQLYKEYLGEPGSPRAHELLHTYYFDRSQPGEPKPVIPEHH